MTKVFVAYPNLNNAIELGLELVVAQDVKQKSVRSILLAPEDGDVVRKLIRDEEYDSRTISPLLLWLLGAQWFPIAVEHTLTESLDKIEKRLECLPSGFAFAEEHSDDAKRLEIWRRSLTSICRKLQTADLPESGIDENFLTDLFYQIPKNMADLVKCGGFN